MKRIWGIILKLLLGPDRDPFPEGNIGHAYQVSCLKRVWEAESVGLTRLLRLAICAAPFAFPTHWITHLLRRKQGNLVSFSSDAYVALRTTVLFILLMCNAKGSWLPTIVALYLLLDLIVYVSGLILLFDVYAPPLSSTRSLLLILLKYGEVILGFAALHRQWGGLNVDPLFPLQALYFSVVTATTLGYGDIVPVASSAQLRVVVQVATSFIFAAVFIAAILSRVGALPANSVATD
jgi:hypothetical protein